MHTLTKLAVASMAGCLIAWSGGADAAKFERNVTQHGVTVHYGIASAHHARSVDRGASTAAPDQPNAPGSYSYHLVVALYDVSTHARIDDAEVTATVTSPAGHARKTKQTKSLERLRVNDTVTYGNYFDMPWNGKYRVDLSILRAGAKKPTHVRFKYDHQS